MFYNIKVMIKASSMHKHDRPELQMEWNSNRRQKPKSTYQHKLIASLKKACDSNLEL